MGDVQPKKGVACGVCPLKDCKLVRGQGPYEAKLIVVGEAPNAQELRAGRPFLGPSGKLLDNVMRQVGINLAEVFVTNSVVCMESSPRTPKTAEIECCKPGLIAEIKERKPKVVLALGKVAVKVLLGVNKPIKDARGAVQWAEHLNAYVVVTYHPTAVLRSPRLHRDFLSDITKAKTMLADDAVQLMSTINVEYEVISDPNVLTKYLLITNRYPNVALDVETDSTGQLLCLGLSVEPQKAVVIIGDALTYGRDRISLWFTGKKCIGHNLKFDMKVLWQHGFTGLSTGADTMLMSYVLNMLVGGHSLKHLVREYLNYYQDYSDLTKPYMVAGLETCPPEILHKYNAHDAALTYLLYMHLERILSTSDQSVLSELLYPASDVLAEMEYLGIMADVPYLKRLDVSLEEELSELLTQLHSCAGTDFNPNSPKQIADVLYNRLGLPVPTRWSTDVDALDMLVRFTNHTMPKLLLKYRNRQKFHATYVRGLLQVADSNSRVHTNFNLHTTVTGRLSSARPINLQNITRGAEARNIFIATPGYTLLDGDFQQAEIRAWGWLSRDESLKSALLSGTDIHTATACLMHGLTPTQVTKDLRTDAKRLAFGTLFMMTPETLASELGTTVVRALELQNKFFIAYKRGREWIKEIQQQVLRDGYYLSHFGRKLRFVVTPQSTSDVLRQAVNYPIQNLASDITLLALIRIHQRIKLGDFGHTRLLLTVHDSIMLETTEPDLTSLVREIKTEMSRDVLDGWLSFEADAQVGLAWGSLKDVGNFVGS